MKHIRRVALCASLALLAAAPLSGQTGHDLFQQALVKERADGDLRGAIAIYERIAREFAQDRALAAKALVQMGRCHEKLGNEEARSAYRRVVQDYADQTEMVKEARGRLTALQRLAARPTTLGIVVRELSDAENLADAGAPSPDGRYLAYTDWATSDIAIRDLSTGESRRLTMAGRQQKPIQFGMDPAFSPDGKSVAFEWHDPSSQSYYDLRIVPADGSAPPRVVYDTAGFYVMGPAWSSDGTHIAVVRYPDETLQGTVDEESKAALLWVSVADGSARVLDTYVLSGYQGLSHSPDDRYVVYGVSQEDEPNRHDIRVAATDGSGSRAIVQHPADDRLLGWVPGTDWALFLSNRSNIWGAWAVRLVDGREQGEPRLVYPGMGQAHPRGFTAAGDLYHTVAVRWFTTFVAPFNAETGAIDTATAFPLPGSTMNPEWSFDGTRLAFREERSDFQLTGYERPLRVLDVATREVRGLADHLNADHPRWSPDGESIVVSAYDAGVEAPDYHGGIYEVDVTDGRARLLRALPSQPMWWMGTAGALSADGGSLFYVLQGVEGQGQAAGTDGRLVRRTLETGAEEELYRSPDLLAQPFGISPDGHYLLFAIRDSTQSAADWSAKEGTRLMLLDVETHLVRELVRVATVGEIESVTWTKDGRYVAYPQFTDYRGDAEIRRSTLWRIPLTGGAPERIAETSGYGGAMSPDGRWIAYTVGGIQWGHMVMENLKAVLER